MLKRTRCLMDRIEFQLACALGNVAHEPRAYTPIGLRAALLADTDSAVW